MTEFNLTDFIDLISAPEGAPLDDVSLERIDIIERAVTYILEIGSREAAETPVLKIHEDREAIAVAEQTVGDKEAVRHASIDQLESTSDQPVAPVVPLRTSVDVALDNVYAEYSETA